MRRGCNLARKCGSTKDQDKESIYWILTNGRITLEG